METKLDWHAWEVLSCVQLRRWVCIVACGAWRRHTEHSSVWRGWPACGGTKGDWLEHPNSPSRRQVEVHANFYGVVLGGSRIIGFGFACTSFHPLERTLVAACGWRTKSFGRRMEEHAAAVGRWRFFHSQHIFTSQEEEGHMGYIFNIYIEIEEDKDTKKPYKWLLWLW